MQNSSGSSRSMKKIWKAFLWDISKSQYKINFKVLKNKEIWLNCDRLRKQNFVIIFLYTMFSSLRMRIWMDKDSCVIIRHTSGINVGEDFYHFIFIFQCLLCCLGMDLCPYMVLWVYWGSWICRQIVFSKTRVVFRHSFFNIFSTSFSFYSLSGAPFVCILMHFMVSHIPLKLRSFFILFCFHFAYLYQSIVKSSAS